MSKLRSRSKVEREMVTELADRGWQHQGRNGQNHERMLWPASGESLIIPGKGPEHFYTKVRISAKRIENGGLGNMGLAARTCVRRPGG